MKSFNAGQQIDVPGLRKIDSASSTTMYIGEAMPGAGDDAPAWQIQRITFDVNGNPTKVEWADKGSQINQWAQRLALTYS